MPPTKSELIHKIDAAWENFEIYLAGLTEQQMTDLCDDQGWNVRDHITHLAAWEEIIVMLLQGKPRIQFLGVDFSQLSMTPIDEINAVIRDHWKHLPVSAAIAEYRRIHLEFLASLQTLTDADLSRPAGQFFPQMSPNETKQVVDVIQDNANGHINEHLPWIQAIVRASGL